MMGLRVKDAQQGFFDRRAVLDAVGKSRAKVLSRGGAYIRRTARSSMRPAPASRLKKIRALLAARNQTRNPIERQRLDLEIQVQRRLASAAPGKPPRTVLGLLKKFLYFAWDSSSRSVVIGPARLNGRSADDIPSVLESGGTTQVTRGRGRVVRTVRIAPHPYMGPALIKEIPKLPGLWADSVKP